MTFPQIDSLYLVRQCQWLLMFN